VWTSILCNRHDMFGGIKMKKMIGFGILFFILYIVYYDVSNGTLPSFKKELELVEQGEVLETSATPVQTSSLPFQEVEVKAGDTLISLVEKLSSNKSTLSIDTLVKDFETLNPGEQANSLIIGKKYKIPIY